MLSELAHGVLQRQKRRSSASMLFHPLVLHTPLLTEADACCCYCCCCRRKSIANVLPKQPCETLLVLDGTTGEGADVA